MKDLMIDLETLGLGPNAVVISIGACFFNIETGEIGEKFYCALDVSDQLNEKRQITPSTLKWWMGQHEAAKKVFSEDAESTFQGLLEFVNFIKRSDSKCEVCPWGNGATFDISIMESLLTQFGLEVPWKFTNVMDLRTYRRFVGGNAKIPKVGIHHNALDDAISQTKYVLKHSVTLNAKAQT